MITFYEKMNDLLTANIPFVAVTVVDSVGSVPNETGTKMLVVAEGLHYGTVGGGKVETRAIEEAKRLLSAEGAESDGKNGGRKADAHTHFVNWSLERDIGMTCGGSVKLYFEAFNKRPWNITIFGAGHCAIALTGLLNNLDCRITCIDPRPEWLSKIPESAKLRKVHSVDMPGEVKNIADGSFVILMT
ncbi:MAG TPA: XdhC family protein, partial [Chroococcales cyanobacterium]